MSRLKWDKICQSDQYRGRWVALDECRYEHVSGRPIEGTVVDADIDLVELCNRIRERDQKHCTLIFCGEPERAAKSQIPADPFRHAAH